MAVQVLGVSIENVDKKFRGVPCATNPVSTGNYDRWTHIVIDEAQDLSVQEASLLCSFVDSRGAITISADFRQIVSPVHGMPDPTAIKYGCPIKDRSTDTYFPFSKNLRQTKEMTDFLRAFYSAAFKEPPPFVAKDSFHDIKPQLHLLGLENIPIRIRQMFGVLQKSTSIRSIALLQINEDEQEMAILRSQLAREAVPLAPVWQPFGDPGQTDYIERRTHKGPGI